MTDKQWVASSPVKEIVALRQVARGVVDGKGLLAADFQHLKRLSLIEERNGTVTLTIAGMQRYLALVILRGSRVAAVPLRRARQKAQILAFRPRTLMVPGTTSASGPVVGSSETG
jgi:hypothetical protein